MQHAVLNVPQSIALNKSLVQSTDAHLARWLVCSSTVTLLIAVQRLCCVWFFYGVVQICQTAYADLCLPDCVTAHYYDALTNPSSRYFNISSS